MDEAPFFRSATSPSPPSLNSCPAPRTWSPSLLPEGACMLADIAIHPNERLVRRLSDPSVHSNMRVLVRHSAYEPWKATFDFCAAVLLLVVAAPVILLAGLLVKLTSRGPMFYAQTRLGRFGQR